MFSGAPEEVHVKTQGSDALEVFWAPPAPQLQHGLPPHTILNYRSTLPQRGHSWVLHWLPASNPSLTLQVRDSERSGSQSETWGPDVTGPGWAGQVHKVHSYCAGILSISISHQAIHVNSRLSIVWAAVLRTPLRCWCPQPSR